MDAPPDTLPDTPPSPQHPSVYNFTEEETRVLLQCQKDSLWYRSVPISVISMVVTKALVSKGILAASPKFGAIPKVAFAGVMGYLIGKASYVNTCKERLLKLENSPLADSIRQAQTYRPQNPNFRAQRPAYSEQNVTKLPPAQSPAPPAPEPPASVYSSQYESSSVDVPFGASMSESSPTGISDNVALEPELPKEKQAKPPPVTYAELRNKNRGSYDVLTSPSPVRPIQDRPSGAKKNKYGDVWEE